MGSIKIIVNDLEMAVPAGAHVKQLLDILEERVRPDMIVEINRKFVHIKDHAITPLKDGDRVEIIYLEMGG